MRGVVRGRARRTRRGFRRPLAPAGTRLATGVPADLKSPARRQHDRRVGIARRTTDPTNQRVVGIKAELAGLARLAETPFDGRHIDVEVRLASFATDYVPVLPPSYPRWVKVNASTLPGLLAATNVIAARNQGLDTDFVTALIHAQAELAQRSAELTKQGGAQPCSAIVWFTDGQYSLEPREYATPDRGLTVPYAPNIPLTTNAAATRVMAIGQNDMCRASGLIDQLRADGTKIFVVALNAEMTTPARLFLESVSEYPTTCGNRARPDSGLFLLASQDSQLLFMFGSLFDTPAQIRFCPKRGQSSCHFTTVAGLSGFSLDVYMPSTADAIELQGPTGPPTYLRPDNPSQTKISGANLATEWFSSHAVEVDAATAGHDDRLGGAWKMSFLAPSGAPVGPGSYTLRLRADLFPAVLAAPRDSWPADDAAARLRRRERPPGDRLAATQRRNAQCRARQPHNWNAGSVDRAGDRTGNVDHNGHAHARGGLTAQSRNRTERGDQPAPRRPNRHRAARGSAAGEPAGGLPENLAQPAQPPIGTWSGGYDRDPDGERAELRSRVHVAVEHPRPPGGRRGGRFAHAFALANERADLPADQPRTNAHHRCADPTSNRRKRSCSGRHPRLPAGREGHGRPRAHPAGVRHVSGARTSRMQSRSLSCCSRSVWGFHSPTSPRSHGTARASRIPSGSATTRQTWSSRVMVA